ncbi:hypothetical protein KOM00_18245 [Geomonas sp. Red69]|uniref:Uncharacterized protein n=1 Tax=Geomonas diazotrophica TaxID=2843197 RepID=A0ABX8JSB1_9BACT|nr:MULTISPECIES: hypothetical protein [Geomonas]MBU5638672.1 hypothetical protein [Geomonas diazotrophica]QWV98295.1 hypothetical protein KP005_03130 [Geomonas nitrogeniifigens]QXE87479.1 hypothetical protein KP003_03495 [Geomonas nitrogeniifigens]
MAYHRILRNYRTIGPTKFHGLNQRFKNSLLDINKIPAWFWAAYPKLREEYLEASDKYAVIYHESMLGGKLAIAERERLQEELVGYLDEIASLLEMAAVRNPELLILSGFDLAKERRSRSRAKKAAAAHDDQDSVPA